MKRLRVLVYLTAVAATLALALTAMGVDAPDAGKTFLLMNGHSFGIGEQQVYAIERSADLSVHFRDAAGTLRTKRYHHHIRTSVAFTIEGVSSAGRPVLAMAAYNPNPASANPEPPPPSPQSPPPSPELDERGSLATAGYAGSFAPASIILSSLNDDVLSAGKKWSSSGSLILPFAKIAVNLENTAIPMKDDQSGTVTQINSVGKTDVRGKVSVAGFGQALLRGSGSALATAFVDSRDKLLLGFTLDSTSRGNAIGQRKRGAYDLKEQLTIKLVHYVPGIAPVVIGPGYIIASGYVGSYASPDTGNFSTAPPNPIAVPAATDTEYMGSPLPTFAPSALPEASLPPIPLPLASDQPIASPPPGPTPTPTPTRY
ncbi:MAG: hypothetical protein M3007_07165 [Candidatus Eremiobacteraeota bacterium]|nr:hypothetical protein [Candidatus Eremiobacteraeota bacterium]